MTLQRIKTDVKEILLEDERSRDNDGILYLRLIERHTGAGSSFYKSLSIGDFLSNMTALGFPPFESVSRARRKAQAENPELQASNIYRFCAGMRG